MIQALNACPLHLQDSKRNTLIEIMLVTTFASVAVLCYTTETGLFGAPRPRMTAARGAIPD